MITRLKEILGGIEEISAWRIIDRSFYNLRCANIRKKVTNSSRFVHKIFTNTFPPKNDSHIVNTLPTIIRIGPLSVGFIII